MTRRKLLPHVAWGLVLGALLLAPRPTLAQAGAGQNDQPPPSPVHTPASTWHPAPNPLNSDNSFYGTPKAAEDGGGSVVTALLIFAVLGVIIVVIIKDPFGLRSGDDQTEDEGPGAPSPDD